MGGFQMRYACLVAGSLAVLLLFAGFHAIFVAKAALPADVLEKFLPVLRASTWRLFFVGVAYISVVTMAAVFLSHRTVGPAQRLEEEIKTLIESGSASEPLKVREGDDFEGLVSIINRLVQKVRGR